MLSGEVKKLLIQVVSSWQVLATTAVLVIYLFIVNYVSRVYLRRPRRSSMSRSRAKAVVPEPMGPSDTDDLGLEETTPESE